MGHGVSRYKMSTALHPVLPHASFHLEPNRVAGVEFLRRSA